MSDTDEVTEEDGPTVTYEIAMPPYPLPDTLVGGMTIWGGWGGAQVRVEATLVPDDEGVLDVGAPQGALYLAFGPDAVRSTEDGEPYRLGREEARALRDLLNVATARGAL